MLTGPLSAAGAYARRLMVTSEVWRKTTVTDAGGGSSTAWSATGDAVRVELVSPSDTERETAAQQGVEVTHTAVLPVDTTVRRGDRLVIGDVTVELVSDPLTATHSAVARATVKQEPFDEPLS